jgi:alkanesulfonate monooxygenase SsuD/methylene tetrahydromethanopterin reductase-like flavin-dependent oxidoreductase (luciferase family)
MKFGIHLDISIRRPFGAETERQAFEQALQLATLADELGFDYCWASEHHFTPEYAHSSAPDVFLAAAAARTKNIRLGVDALTLKANRPAHIAERIAVLDLVSNGRADLALSRPVLWADATSTDDTTEYHDAWAETVRTVPQMWDSERIVPKPCQNPHPPLWTSVVSAERALEAASLGMGVLCPPSLERAQQPRRIAEYRERIERCQAAGKFVNSQVMLTDLLFCHPGNSKGAEAGTRLLNAARDLASAQVSLGDLGIGDAPALPQGTTIGEPDTLINTLREFESAGASGIVFRLNAADALLPSETIESLQLFADEVLPVFKRQRARAAAE